MAFLTFLEPVVNVLDVGDQTLETDDGLDTDTVVAVLNGVALHSKTLHRRRLVDCVAAERPDRHTVATAAKVVAKHRVGTGLHGETVVQVVDLVAGDGDVVVLGQVEAVRVLSQTVAGTRVERQTAQRGLLGRDNAERAERGVLEREARQGRAHDVLQTEEHGSSDRLPLLPVPWVLLQWYSQSALSPSAWWNPAEQHLLNSLGTMTSYVWTVGISCKRLRPLVKALTGRH
ncbi:hypothetical protein GN244_ATG02300 [Phytophthora infestans]|uniref:Uncharacterized protein n=1 Tax=Phytophthora infestans TaxID=4787 RepID=A0A833SBX5_PHYIN|nr:hypothetical protein GN244_ATG02300 [Phytophthora infestans]